MKVFSLNSFVRPKPIKTNARDYRMQRMRLLLSRVKNYDVVCLQEFFCSRSNRAIVDWFTAGMTENGFIFSQFGPHASCLRPISGGLAMFSKRAPDENGQLPFCNKGSSVDKFACKGFQWAHFGEVLLINTHLYADYAKNASVADYTEYLLYLSEIIDFLRQQKAKNVLLLGDLNIDGIAGRYVAKNDRFDEYERVQYVYDLVSGAHSSAMHADMPSIGRQHSSGYCKMMHLFEGFADLCLETYGAPPITFRDCDVINGVVAEQDRYLNPPGDLCSCRRLDYCLGKCQDRCHARVLAMKVLQSEHPFLRKLSDHSALEVVIGRDFDDAAQETSVRSELEEQGLDLEKAKEPENQQELTPTYAPESKPDKLEVASAAVQP